MTLWHPKPEDGSVDEDAIPDHVRRERVCRFLKTGRVMVGKNVMWNIDGFVYCRAAFEFIFGFRARPNDHAHKSITNWLGAIRREQDPAASFGHYEAIGRSRLREDAIEWLVGFAKKTGEDVVVGNAQVTRLAQYKYIEVYDFYQDAMGGRGDGGEFMCYESFLRNWHMDAPWIVLRSHYKSTFAECPICSAYRETMRKALKPEDRRAARLAHFRHLEDQRCERRAYKARRDEGEDTFRSHGFEDVNSSLSIIVDAMDGWKTKLPHLGDRASKDLKDDEFLKQKVIGVKVHGWKTFSFLVYPELSGDSNLYIEILRYDVCLFVCLSVCLSLWLAATMCGSIYIGVSLCLFASLLLCLSAYPSAVRLPACLPACLSLSFPLWPCSFCLFIWLSLCISAWLFLCLSVSLSQVMWFSCSSFVYSLGKFFFGCPRKKACCPVACTSRATTLRSTSAKLCLPSATTLLMPRSSTRSTLATC